MVAGLFIEKAVKLCSNYVAGVVDIQVQGSVESKESGGLLEAV